MTDKMDQTVIAHHFADLEDVRLHYVEAGDPRGPLIILLHGFPEFWYSWRHQIPVLSEAGFRVIAPDMRGYNLSSKPSEVESYGADYLSRDVAALIQHCERDSATVVGHDWGGGVAWYFAMRYPQLLNRLVVMNAPHPEEFPIHLLDPSQLLKSLYMLIFQVPGLGERMMAKNNFAKLRRLYRNNPVNPLAFSSEDIERYVEAAARPGALTAMTNYYRAAAKALFRPRAFPVQPVRAPTLVIWGQQDTALAPSLAEVRRSLAPRLTIQ
ncbi:MAG: alpha/beta hydrolase, partial [Planctomycetota bacterium]|nr:alpha/beta hydrolase [Planctomycetota bacterium]